MTTVTSSSLRRWDGQTKEAVTWDGFDRDIELNEADADCFIYLLQQQLESKQHCFSIRFERLITGKCQPLIKKVIVSENQTINDRPRSSSGYFGGKDNPRPTCYLYLPVPAQYKDSEAEQYHITTRNFFAWILNKSVVGPDPATALLALKVRMDLWRSPNIDNFSALYKYAKMQTYGELGDMQMFLTKRLKGETIDTASYTMKSADAKSPLKRRRLGSSFRTKMFRVRARVPRRMSVLGKSTFGRPQSSYGTRRSENEFLKNDTVMSGAIGVAKAIDRPSTSHEDSSFISLPPIERSQSSLSDMVFSADKATFGGVQHQSWDLQKRRFSLPTMKGDEVSALYEELEQQEDWIKNLSKEHHDQQKLSLWAESSTSTMRPVLDMKVGDLADISQVPSSVHRHRRAKSLSRPPSPIVEEVVVATPSQIKKGKMIASPDEEEPVMRLSTPATCPRTALPSHTDLYCKTCARPKGPKTRLGHSSDANISRILQHHRDDSRNTKRAFSFDSVSEKIIQNSHFDKLNAMATPSLPRTPAPDPVQEPGLDLQLPANDDRPSRFPSLRKANRATFPGSKTELNKLGSTASKRPKIVPWSEQRALPGNTPRAQSMVLPDTGSPALRPIVPTRIGSYNQSKATDLTPLKTTLNPKAGTHLQMSIAQSPSELYDPVSAVTSDSGAEHDGSGVSWSGATPLETGFLSGTSSQPGSRRHRVPLNEPSTADSASVIDMILHEVDAHSVRASGEGQHYSSSRFPDNTVSRFANSSAAELRAQEQRRPVKRESVRSAKSSEPSGRRLRHSLGLWHAKRTMKDDVLVGEYQGCVLTMDSSGKFTMVASPDILSRETHGTGLGGRSETPLCELP